MAETRAFEDKPFPLSWRELEAQVNGRQLFGMAGVRDPDGPCDVFAPVEGIDWLGVRVTARGNGDCDGDGHYLCLGCERVSAARIRLATDGRMGGGDDD